MGYEGSTGQPLPSFPLALTHSTVHIVSTIPLHHYVIYTNTLVTANTQHTHAIGLGIRTGEIKLRARQLLALAVGTEIGTEPELLFDIPGVT